MLLIDLRILHFMAAALRISAVQFQIFAVLLRLVHTPLPPSIPNNLGQPSTRRLIATPSIPSFRRQFQTESVNPIRFDISPPSASLFSDSSPSGFFRSRGRGNRAKETSDDSNEGDTPTAAKPGRSSSVPPPPVSNPHSQVVVNQLSASVVVRVWSDDGDATTNATPGRPTSVLPLPVSNL